MSDCTKKAAEPALPKKFVPAPDLAGLLVLEIAEIARRTDRLCFYEYDAFDGDSQGLVDAEHVGLVLGRLRDTIKHIGWLADLASSKLGDVVVISDVAEQWLMTPQYNNMRADAESKAAESGDAS